MDITNFDPSFSPRRSEGGPHVRGFLAGLRLRVRGARRKYAARGPVAGLAIDDHTLRDIGFTRFGVSEAELAKHNEAG